MKKRQKESSSCLILVSKILPASEFAPLFDIDIIFLVSVLSKYHIDLRCHIEKSDTTIAKQNIFVGFHRIFDTGD